MILKDYYKILELDTSKVSSEEIKMAYRAAAKKYHPDVNVGDVLAEERIKDINEAYKVLSEPATKRKYDRKWNAYNPNKTKQVFNVKKQNKAIINMFLGKEEKESAQKENKKNPIKGENVETEIKASLYEAFYGLEKKIALRTMDGGMRNFTVTIPEGIRNGEKIRLIGQGKPGKNGGKNGDLFLKINIVDDKKFKLQGSDIYTDLLLTPWEAALGTRASVQAIDDETKVYIPQGIQSGERIRIPGKGYKDGNGARGDLVAEVKVMVPKQLTKQEKIMFEKLNEISSFNPRKE